MQLLLSAVLALLAVGPAVCWPMDDTMDQAFPRDSYSMEQSEDSYLSAMNEQPLYVNEQQANSQTSYNPYYADSQAEDTPLPRDAADELKKQMDATKEQPGGGEAELQATSSGRVLDQGCTVALQFVTNNRWLGCAGATCIGATCPFIFFEGADWTKCWGEVFQLYRAAGPGHIRVGDFVGLYYPRERRWFSLFQNYGRKLPCPGPPTQKFGFHHPDSWKHCGAEVFQIYAKGKGNGAVITDQDTLNFYFPAAHTYVQFRNDKIQTSKCLLNFSGQRRPPNNHAVDVCYLEAVEITIRD